MQPTRTRVAGFAAAVTAAVTAAVVVQPGADAAQGPGPAPDTGMIWIISRQDVDVATSRQCTGLGSRSDVVELRNGSEPNVVVKSAGRLHPTDVTCSLGISDDRRVYDWRRQVEDGNLPAARGTVFLTLYDSSGVPVQRWRLTNAWPSQYLLAFDRAVVTLAHERAVLVS